jgi:hypothetical protein
MLKKLILGAWGMFSKLCIFWGIGSKSNLYIPLSFGVYFCTGFDVNVLTIMLQNCIEDCFRRIYE